MPAYFSSFTVVTRDADGFLSPLTGETLSIYDDTDTEITTTQSDDFGFVESELISGTAGDAVYFKSASYAPEFHQSLAASEDEALFENIRTQFIIDDLFTEEAEATAVDVWLWYPDTPEFQPLKIGTAAPGTSLKYPIESFYSKEVRVSIIPKTEDFAQLANKLADAEYGDFSLDSQDPSLDDYIPVSTDSQEFTATGDVTAYSEQIIGNSLSPLTLNIFFDPATDPVFIAKNIGTGLLTITSEHDDTFNGISSMQLIGGEVAVVVSTGANWLRIS